MGEYHPLYSGLWNDDKLEGLPFENKGFYAYLFANERTRPSGIYRATDEQIAADTELPLAKVRAYLSSLADRRRIIRDGSWVFVRKRFKRTPKSPRMLQAVETDLEQCSSVLIVNDFFETYPLFKQRLPDRWQTVSRPSPDSQPTVNRPCNRVTDPISLIPNSVSLIPNPQSLIPKKKRKTLSGKPDIPSLNGFISDAIAYLNERTGKRFSPNTKTTIAHLAARASESFTLEDVRVVVDYKVTTWANDPKMHEYLRPETLFGVKFESYLQAAKADPDEIQHGPQWEVSE